MWDLPRSRIEPVSPALADRFFTTEPPGKSISCEHLSVLSCLFIKEFRVNLNTD